MGTRADGVREARSLFQERGSGAIPTSALCLTLEPIDFAHAKRLNALWHSRLPRIGTGFVKNQPYPCWAAIYEGRYYAVAIWSPPVARLLLQDWSWLELRRLAVAPDAPRNTASRCLGVMTRLIRRHRPNAVRLISYQDTEVHTGCIYRAAGWSPTTVGGGSWNWPSRPRPEAQSEAPLPALFRCLLCPMCPGKKCEVCRVRIPEHDHSDAIGGVGPGGTEAGVPPPER